MAPHAQLGPDFLGFLGELADNNDRRWFEEQKPRYEASVRDPFLRLITNLGHLLVERCQVAMPFIRFLVEASGSSRARRP